MKYAILFILIIGGFLAVGAYIDAVDRKEEAEKEIVDIINIQDGLLTEYKFIRASVDDSLSIVKIDSIIARKKEEGFMLRGKLLQSNASKETINHLDNYIKRCE